MYEVWTARVRWRIWGAGRGGDRERISSLEIFDRHRLAEDEVGEGRG